MLRTGLKVISKASKAHDIKGDNLKQLCSAAKKKKKFNSVSSN